MNFLFKITILILVSNLMSATAAQSNEIVVIETKLGSIALELFENKAPGHVKNFQDLVQKGFYNGTTFHRVIPGFMVQGGDPNSKSLDRSSHGMGGPGYSIKAEFNDTPHKRGILSMARSQDPNSAGSQFFIVVKDAGFLDGKYTAFGRVTKGMDVVDKIVNAQRDSRDNPITRVVMDSVRTAYSYENIENTKEARKLARERKKLEEELKNLKREKNRRIFDAEINRQLKEEQKEQERLRLAEMNRQLDERRKLLEEERKKLEALRLAEENRQRQAQAEKGPPPKQPSKQKPQSGTGSGFFVSKMGHVITNAHVVQNCKKVTIGDNANKQVPAELINSDRSNDLALLQLSTLEMASAESKSLIQKLGIVVVPLASKGLLRSDDVRLGEKVLVAGYPFGEFFSNTIKVTTGVVSATRGAGDDSGQFQLDAAVQPGNSGGPIYDSGGNIVGVVISQLDKLKMAKAIGSLPENVNFGIKVSTVRQFLTSNGLPSKKSERTEEKPTEQLAEIAKNQALMVMCLQ